MNLRDESYIIFLGYSNTAYNAVDMFLENRVVLWNSTIENNIIGNNNKIITVLLQLIVQYSSGH